MAEYEYQAAFKEYNEITDREDETYSINILNLYECMKDRNGNIVSKKDLPMTFDEIDRQCSALGQYIWEACEYDAFEYETTGSDRLDSIDDMPANAQINEDLIDLTAEPDVKSCECSLVVDVWRLNSDLQSVGKKIPADLYDAMMKSAASRHTAFANEDADCCSIYVKFKALGDENSYFRIESIEDASFEHIEDSDDFIGLDLDLKELLDEILAEPRPYFTNLAYIGGLFEQLANAWRAKYFGKNIALEKILGKKYKKHIR